MARMLIDGGRTPAIRPAPNPKAKSKVNLPAAPTATSKRTAPAVADASSGAVRVTSRGTRPTTQGDQAPSGARAGASERHRFTAPSAAAPTSAGSTSDQPSPPSIRGKTGVGAVVRDGAAGSGSGSATPAPAGKSDTPPLSTGKKTGADDSAILAETEAAVHRSEEYFRSRFGRDGYDGRGGEVSVEVDRESRGGAEARSSASGGATIAIGMTPGSVVPTLMAPTDDVITHEFAHLVIFEEDRNDEVRPSGSLAARQRRAAEYTAIHEGLADVFGAAAERDWNMADHRNPSTGEGVVTHRRDADPDDPHEWGGVLSNAAADMQASTGWEVMEEAFYGAVVDERRTRSSSMNDVARYVVEAAYEAGGAEAAAAARAAFRDNGLLQPPPSRLVPQ